MLTFGRTGTLFGTYGLESVDISSVSSGREDGTATRQPVTQQKVKVTYHPPSPTTASSIPPIAIIRLLRKVPPSNDRVESVGTGDGIHFSSSVGIDIKLKLDLAEFGLVVLWNLALELDGRGW